MITNHHTKDRVIHYFLVSIILFVLVSIAFVSVIIYKEQQLSNKIYPNVYIDHINVGGKTKAEVLKIFEKKYSTVENKNFTMIYKNEAVATMSAQQISLRPNTLDVINDAYQVGRAPLISTRIYEKLTTLFKTVPYNFYTHLTFDPTVVANFISDFSDRYHVPAKNALFTFENGKVTTFREHENGLKINSVSFIQDFEKSVREEEKNPEDKTITISDSVVEPEVKLSEANTFGIEEEIGEGQSDFHHSDPSRIHNLTLAAAKFNGVIIPKDQEFSFNQTIGDVSPLTGYVPGYVILNGKTVLGDGGGVCQVSTTIFRAVLNTGLPVTERHNHAYRVIYYENDQPPGLDATIFLPNVDFKFKNDTPAAILVQTEIDPVNEILYFRFYGKKDSRRVELTKPVLSDQTPPPPPITQEDPTLPRGVTKQVEHAIPGGKSVFSYKVFNGDKVSFQKTFVSVYQAWAAVTLVGTKDN